MDWLAAYSPLKNTDDNLLLEHSAPRDLFLEKRPGLLASLDERRSVGARLHWPAGIRRKDAEPLMIPRLMSRQVFGTSDLFSSWLRALRLTGIADAEALDITGLPATLRMSAQDDGRDLARELDTAARSGDAAALSRLLASERTRASP